MITTLWAILAVILFVSQFASGVFDLLFVAVAAMLVAIASAVVPGFADAIWLQVLLWVAGSFASVWAFRKRFRKLFRGEELVKDKQKYVGEKARVIEAITPDRPGRISFQGTSWTALSIGEAIPAGVEVFIIEHEDMNFTVTQRLLDDDGRNPPIDGPDSPRYLGGSEK
jgi:membrane protein implicated in regulation of membrane protease activity